MGGVKLCSIGAFLLVCAATVTQGAHIPLGMDMMTSARCFADIAFVLDSSGSVGEDNWRIVKSFVKNFTHMLHFSMDENQVAVISYGNDAHLHINLRDYESQADVYAYLNDTLDNRVPWLNQHTNTAAGLRMVSDHVFTPEAGDRSNFPNVVILLSDGYHTMATNDTEPLANELKTRAHIITIGIGSEGVNNTELMKIASTSSSFYGLVNFGLLTTILQDIISNVCRITNTCSNKDLAFVLDSSGSMGFSNFEKTKRFVKHFMANLRMGPEHNQVALLAYSTTSRTISRLGEMQSQAALNATVDAVTHVNQRTNISGAIRQTVRDIFEMQPVGRRDATDVMILLTDGWDNTDMNLMFENARLAKAAGVRIVTVGVGEHVNMLNMMRLASAPGFHNTFVALDHDHLVMQAMSGRGETLYDLVCAHPTRYPPPAYPVSTANYRRNLIIVLDASVAAGRDRFGLICAFLEAAMEELHIDSHVAVVTHGRGTATVPLTFNNYHGIELSVLVASLEYKGGSPNLISAIVNSLLLDGTPGVPTQVLVMAASGVQVGGVSSPELAAKYGLASSSWDSLGGLIEDMADQLYSRQYYFYTVAMGASTPEYELAHELMGRYQPIEGFAYSLAGLDSAQQRSFVTALLAKSCLHAAETLWQCDFDAEGSTPAEQLCGAQNTDLMDFELRSGSTPSRRTGPVGAFSLPYYIYIEATNRRPGEHAVLRLPRTDVEGPVCLHFMRHMYGWHTGALQVVTYDSQNNERIVWQQYGPQSDQWLYVQAQLSPHLGEQIAVIASRAYGYSGDIALDSMTLKRGPCDLPEEMIISLAAAKVPVDPNLPGVILQPVTP